MYEKHLECSLCLSFSFKLLKRKFVQVNTYYYSYRLILIVQVNRFATTTGSEI